MKVLTNHELTERVDLLQRGVAKLIDCFTSLDESMQSQSSINSLQLVAHTMQDEQIKELEKRIDHMEEYIDKLTKRVKELEKNSNTKHSCNCSVCNKSGTSH